jgi:hypothetical protein
MNLETRIKVERQVVRFLCRTMKANGWEPVAVNDGERRHATSTIKDVMEHVFGVDEARIVFHHKAIDKKHTALIVLGNDGYDAIADYGYSDDDDFNSIMENEVDMYVDRLVDRHC